MNDVDGEAWERRLDGGLGEIEGGAAPPDVTARVLARVAQAESPAPTGRTGGRQQAKRWLAAAALLLGIGVVVGVALLSRDTSSSPSAPEPTNSQDPQYLVVKSAADAAALPNDARAVLVQDQGDAVLETIAQRCPGLERLQINCLQKPESSPTDRVFAIAASLTKLRDLQLVKARAVTGKGLDRLAQLPVLETLAFGFMELGDEPLAALPRLPALRQLDLSYTRGFGHAGMAAIARCQGLRQLGVAGCTQLTEDDVALIAQLTNLEILEARQLTSSFDRLQLGGLQNLRNLDLQHATLTATLLDHLPPSVTTLLLGNSAVDDEGCKILRQRVPALRKLGLRCTNVSDVGVAHVLALRRLENLDLSACKNVSAISVDLLAAATQVRRLTLANLDWLTLAHVERLLAQGIAVDLDGATSRDSEFARAVAALQQRYTSVVQERAARIEFVVVDSVAGIGSPPPPVLEGHNLDDAAVAALVAHVPKLERLRLRSGEQVKTYNGTFAPQTSDRNRRDFTDAGLARVAELGELIELELAGTPGVGDDGIASLQKLPKLARLHLACFDVSDRALEALPGMPALRSLRIELTFGVTGKGIRTLTACRQVEDLALAGLPQLQDQDLAALGRMTWLRSLSLASLATTRNDNNRVLTAAEQDRREAAISAAAAPTAGLTDRALLALRDLSHLDHLDLAFGRLTGAGLAALTGMSRLSTLVLAGNVGIDAASLAQLPHSLASLDLTGCAKVGDHVVAALAGQQLSSLSLSRCERLTDDGLAALLDAQPLLRRLDLAGCSGLTARSADLLVATARIQELDVTGCAGWTKERVDQVRSSGRRVAFRVW